MLQYNQYDNCTYKKDYMLITEWNREGQRVIYNDWGVCTEALVTFSRTTLGGFIKHYGIDNEGNDVLFYENQVISVIEKD